MEHSSIADDDVELWLLQLPRRIPLASLHGAELRRGDGLPWRLELSSGAQERGGGGSEMPVSSARGTGADAKQDFVARDSRSGFDVVEGEVDVDELINAFANSEGTLLLGKGFAKSLRLVRVMDVPNESVEWPARQYPEQPRSLLKMRAREQADKGRAAPSAAPPRGDRDGEQEQTRAAKPSRERSKPTKSKKEKKHKRHKHKKGKHRGDG